MVEDEDPLVDLVFTIIKGQMDRDATKYEDKLARSSKLGQIGNLKRWHPGIYQLYESKQIWVGRGR